MVMNRFLRPIILISVIIIIVQIYILHNKRVQVNYESKYESESEEKNEKGKVYKKNMNIVHNHQRPPLVNKKNDKKNNMKNDEKEGGLLIMTCCRGDVYQETVNSIEMLREKGNFSLVLSHDIYDEKSIDVSDNIQGSMWKGGLGVYRVVNPYRKIYNELFPDKNIVKEWGTKAIKCHWVWAMKFVFDVLDLPYVIYIEDDFVVSPDLLIAFRELHKNGRRLCESKTGKTEGMMCTINLGCRQDCYGSKSNDPSKVVFFPGAGHTGSVFYKDHWNAIRENIDDFCGIVEDNWDMSMRHLVAKEILPRDTLTYAYSRVGIMKKVSSSRVGSSQSSNVNPINERKEIQNSFLNNGMNEYSVNLSNLKRIDIKRRGGTWSNPVRKCKRQYTHLCKLAAHTEISVKKWETINDNIQVPVLNDLGIDIDSIDYKTDDCWPTAPTLIDSKSKKIKKEPLQENDDGTKTKWITIIIPTVSRKDEEDYLSNTLDSLINQLPNSKSHPFFDKIQILVINHNPKDKEHVVFEKNSIMKRNYVKFLSSYQYGKRKKNCSHLKECHKFDFMWTIKFIREYIKSEYVLFSEDDWKICTNGFRAMIYVLEKAIKQVPNFVSIRISYGLNGIIMKQHDLRDMFLYFKSYQDLKKPPDHIIYDYWISTERPIVRFRYNIYYHIGKISSVNAKSGYSLRTEPCFGYLYSWLQQGEVFDNKSCPYDDISPCPMMKKDQILIDWDRTSKTLCRKHFPICKNSVKTVKESMEQFCRIKREDQDG